MVRNRRKAILIAVVPALIGIAVYACYYAADLLSLGAAFKAKTLCSGVFVSNRAPAAVLSEDIYSDNPSILKLVNASIDYEKKQVTGDAFGLFTAKSICRGPMGCTLVHNQEYPGTSAPLTPDSENLPVEYDSRLKGALDWAFSEDDPAKLRRTRAVVILAGGRIAAERYAPGFDRDTRLIGWSMSKSVVNALVAIMVKEGRLSVDGPFPLTEWQRSGDPRGRITLDNLLKMSSGLKFTENYQDPRKDVLRMLFYEPDMGAYAAAKELEAEPGSKWQYSSGTTNIICLVLRRLIGDAAYTEMPRRYLFQPLGMNSPVFEQDESGTFVGSSFIYASARDWARFGQLYLQDGIWQGRRVLPRGWVSYTMIPAPLAPEGQYGAHFWLKVPGEFRSAGHEKNVPADAFHAVGHEGQFVSVIPSLQLVIVRLGLSKAPSSWEHDVFIEKVISSLKAPKALN